MRGRRIFKKKTAIFIKKSSQIVIKLLFVTFQGWEGGSRERAFFARWTQNVWRFWVHLRTKLNILFVYFSNLLKKPKQIDVIKSIYAVISTPVNTSIAKIICSRHCGSWWWQTKRTCHHKRHRRIHHHRRHLYRRVVYWGSGIVTVPQMLYNRTPVNTSIAKISCSRHCGSWWWQTRRTCHHKRHRRIHHHRRHL